MKQKILNVISTVVLLCPSISAGCLVVYATEAEQEIGIEQKTLVSENETTTEPNIIIEENPLPEESDTNIHENETAVDNVTEEATEEADLLEDNLFNESESNADETDLLEENLIGDSNGIVEENELLDGSLSEESSLITEESGESTNVTEENEDVNEKLRAVGESREVKDAKGLADALKDKVSVIYLTENIALGNEGDFHVVSDVIIDGKNQFTITSSQGNHDNKGIHYNGDGLKIHYRNITFGGLYGDFDSLQGIAPVKSGTGLTLTLENVTYKSDKGAQVIQFNDQASKVIFIGNNTFTMSAQDGQEFAEGSNFIFEAGSSTTIIDNNCMGDGGFIKHDGKPLNFELKENAKVDITSTHNFSASKGNVDKRITITLGKNAIADFSTQTNQVFNGAVVDFELNNSSRLSFKSNSDVPRNTGPAGIGVGSTINFKEDKNEFDSYKVSINDTEPRLLTITSPESWSVDDTGFQPVGLLTAEHIADINSAKKLVFEKDVKPEPQINLSWSETKLISNQSIEGQDMYDIQMKPLEVDFFYNQSFGEVTFKLMQSGNLVKDGIGSSNGEGSFVIQHTDLSHGENTFTLEAYSGDKLISSIDLTVEVAEGSLRLENVPDNLSWTNRLLSDFRGQALHRDEGNQMTLQVIDSRENKNTNWELKASLETSEALPFDFIWKEGNTSEELKLDEAVVLSPVVLEPTNMVYEKEWEEDAGILIKGNSLESLAIGEYKDAKIKWLLIDASKAE